MAGYIKHDMILEHAQPWEIEKLDGIDSEGRGDACWRLGIYYMCTGEQWAKESLVGLLTERRRYWGDQLHPKMSHPIDDFTRDQLIMGLVALYMNGDDEFYTIPVPYRISKSTRLTPDLYYWIKYLRSGKAKYKKRYEYLMLAEMNIMNKKDSLVKNTLLRKYDIQLIDSLYEAEHHVWTSEWDQFKQRGELLYPMFARHLNSWKNYCINPSDKVKIATVQHVSKANVVLHELNRVGNIKKILPHYDSRVGYVWQERIENPTTSRITILDQEDGIHIDRLVLERLGLIA